MNLSVIAALLFSGSRESWLSFALGIAAGVVVVMISKRLRRKGER